MPASGDTMLLRTDYASSSTLTTRISLADTGTVPIHFDITVDATGESSLTASNRIKDNHRCNQKKFQNKSSRACKSHTTAKKEKKSLLYVSLRVMFYLAILLLCGKAERSNS